VEVKPVKEAPAKTVLLIENEPEQVLLIRGMLNCQGTKACELIHVQCVNEAEEYLARASADMILLELGLTDVRGMRAVKRISAAAPNTSMVLLASLDDEPIAVQAMQEGAQDYLIKGQFGTRELMRILSYAAERKNIENALHDEKERAQIALDCVGDAVIRTDKSGSITFMNRVAKRMTGWDLKHSTGQNKADSNTVDAVTRKAVLELMAKAALQNKGDTLPLSGVHLSQERGNVFIEDSVTPIQNQAGKVDGAVFVFRDVGAMQSSVAKFESAAQHDILTGLPNRGLLIDRVARAILLARRNKGQAAVLFMNLSGFKNINDTMGFPIGDMLLQSIAKRLMKCVRAPDTVSRYGGVEFVVLLEDLKHPQDAATTAQRLLRTVAEIDSIDHHSVHVTANIGVSVYPGDGEDAETLINKANITMIQAKKNGQQNYKFFGSAMNTDADKRQSIEESLRDALARDEISLHYQPKFDLKTGAITGIEALARWVHPTLGSISPEQFIPIAEASGLFLPIGNWVLREACAQARKWADAGVPKKVTVNVSRIQLQNNGFLDSLFETLNATGLDAEWLELDVTESVLNKPSERTISTLKVLKNRGVKLSIDNFGTADTSLKSLRKLPLDALKIDRTFVRGIIRNPEETTLVRAMIGIGQTLNLRVIAEGVETIESLKFLQAHHCDEAQGNYFGEPGPPGQLAGQFITE